MCSCGVLQFPALQPARLRDAQMGEGPRHRGSDCFHLFCWHYLTREALACQAS